MYTYPAGTRLFYAPDGGNPTSRWPVHVWWCPPLREKDTLLAVQTRGTQQRNPALQEASPTVDPETDEPRCATEEAAVPRLVSFLQDLQQAQLRDAECQQWLKETEEGIRKDYSSPSAPRLPPHPESLLTFDIAIGGKEHASTLSESFGRFVDLPAPGSPRECHGLGNLRGDEAWEEERNGQGLTSEQNNVIRRTGADFRVWNGGEEGSRRVGRPITYGGSVETAGRGRSEGPGSAYGGGGETADAPRNEAGGGGAGPPYTER